MFLYSIMFCLRWCHYLGPWPGLTCPWWTLPDITTPWACWMVRLLQNIYVPWQNSLQYKECSIYSRKFNIIRNYFSKRSEMICFQYTLIRTEQSIYRIFTMDVKLCIKNTCINNIKKLYCLKMYLLKNQQDSIIRKTKNVQGWASVLFNWTFRSLRSFPFFIKERSNLSVFRSL